MFDSMRTLFSHGGFLLLPAIALAVAVYQERSFRTGLRQWAARSGWQVVRHPQPVMSRGDRTRFTVTVSGVLQGRSVSIAQYQYTSTSTDSSGHSSSTTHRYTVTSVRLSRPFTRIAVSRRGVVSRFGRTLFGDRATVTGYEPFDRAFQVIAADGVVVSSVLGPQLLAEHVTGELPEWSVDGRELLTTRAGRIGRPAAIQTQFAPLLRVAQLLDPAGDPRLLAQPESRTA